MALENPVCFPPNPAHRQAAGSSTHQIPFSQARFKDISLVCTQVLVERNETCPKTKGKKADPMQNLSAFQKLSR